MVSRHADARLPDFVLRPQREWEISRCIVVWWQSHSHSESFQKTGNAPCPAFTRNRRYRDNGIAKMFEVAVFCIVLIAIAYSAFLWRMGRRDDVLHGQFIAPSSSRSPASTLDIDASLKSLLQTIERDLCESGN
jgi:hypothetical protein